MLQKSAVTRWVSESYNRTAATVGCQQQLWADICQLTRHELQVYIHQYICPVLVEAVEHHFSIAQVTPAAVKQQQPLQVAAATEQLTHSIRHEQHVTTNMLPLAQHFCSE